MVYHYCHVLFSSYFHVTFINALELTWSELVLSCSLFQLLFWIASFLPCDWYLSSLQFMFDKYELCIEFYRIIELWQWNLIGDDSGCMFHVQFLFSIPLFISWVDNFWFWLWIVKCIWVFLCSQEPSKIAGWGLCSSTSSGPWYHSLDVNLLKCWLLRGGIFLTMAWSIQPVSNLYDANLTENG